MHDGDKLVDEATDEPTGNLDSKTSNAVMALFQELGRAGLTIVFVTHEPDGARFAARVPTVKDGQILSDTRQTPEQAVVPVAPAPAVAA